jgi:hypothetical protein
VSEHAVDVATDRHPPEPDDAVPPRRNWRERFRILELYADPILKVLLIVTVLLGGYEYLHRQQAGRVEQSLALVDEWKSDGHRDAYQRVNDLVWPKYAEMAPQMATATLTDEDRTLIFGNIGDSVTGQDDDFSTAADRDVDQIFYFFERAALCSNERICDYDVINTFLGEEARTFWLYFSRYAERRQTLGYTNYGVWTERLARGAISRSPFGLI